MEHRLEQRLGDYAFHKSIFPSPEEVGDAVFGFRLWRDADRRGTAETVLLREAAHGGSRYRVYAYCVHGEIPAPLLDQLRAIVLEADLGEIRYESFAVKGFSCLYDGEGDCFQEDYTLLPLYRQMDGVYLAVVADDDGDVSELDCPAVAYAVNGDGMYQWCVARKYLAPDYAYPTTDEDPDLVEVPEETDEDVMELLSGVLGAGGVDPEAYAQMLGAMQSGDPAAQMAGQCFAMGAAAAQELPDAPTPEAMAKAYQDMATKQMAAFGAMMGRLYGEDAADGE